ncbi:MAG TPA: penicillin acylase family protein [Gemmatimonadaceae bacterium]|nr:penicillin acylase family protein [Gemmatimonadaceae bacterium]
MRLLLLLALVAPPSRDTLHARALLRPVEILRDGSGISHIYAQNEHDLFFAQGYVAATDRLFQLELWRRQATGTVAELLGPRELQRDIGSRLFKFRGNMQSELAHYHPHGPAIIQAFVDGVNAYIAETERDPTKLPLEFRLLNTKPGRWTPDVVISRHGGLLGNITEELNTTRAVAAVGANVVKALDNFHPGDPDLTIDPTIDKSLLSAPILALYQAYRAPLRFQPSDLAPASRADNDSYLKISREAASAYADLTANHVRDIGSNNWVVSPRLAFNGSAILANDPHRAQSVPSLRYWVHLVAPGWNVIGGGEPEIPGVSVGHNEYGAWGLTIFATDGEDLYVYETNPANPRQYRYRGTWETMRSVKETIAVKGAASSDVTLRYTRHGPVVYEDTAHHVAYAVRAAWLEPGSSPYLASLRMDQAKTWEEFRTACASSFIPGENMIWADRTGNIGWQAVGIAPIRPNSSGLVAVPGDGRFEWAGYLPIKEKPHALNPAEGFIATANNDLIPYGYPHMNAVGFVWTDPYRWARISEVLGAGRKLAVPDMMRLQTDYLSIMARQLVPLLRDVSVAQPSSETDRARKSLLAWDFVLDKQSVAAGIYETWYRHLSQNVSRVVVSESARPFFRTLSATRVVEQLIAPSGAFGKNPTAARDSLLVTSLAETVAELTQKFGADESKWIYGQPGYHYALITHPLSAAVNASTRAKLDVGPAPRGGDATTVGATGNGGNQTAGASFRMIVDVGDWERAVGTNTPGQSGDPDNPHYRDLFALWADDRYFPVPFARARVEAAAETRWVLAPEK